MVDDTLSLIGELQSLHQSVATKTKTLHDACDQLLVEKQRLIEFADALRSRLNYFDELENVSTSFYASNMNIVNEQFLPLLKRLDDFISYVESNPQYAESSVYLVKFRQLQSRALGMIRSHVLSVLKAIKGSATGKAVASEGVEESIIYVRFKAAASELKPILKEIEDRASRKEYAQILSECHKLYCEQRLYLLKGIVQQRVSEYAKREPLPSLTRSGCSYLMQVCQFENQLFDHFFPTSSKDVSSLAPLMDPLCTYLYDTLRPRLIHEANLDALCELVDILKVEVLGEQLSRRADIYEVLSSSGLTHLNLFIGIRHGHTGNNIHSGWARCFGMKIANYHPSDADLDYPKKLERTVEAASTPANEDNSDIYETWFRPLEKTVSCLSKLYHCLEPAVFTGLAQEAVEVCSISIQNASKSIGKKSGQMDGQLFLIKHLLILREQIAPFDMHGVLCDIQGARLLSHAGTLEEDFERPDVFV
ncbi:hypothetical protein LUZ63_015560 [Rhynchospora breviuscula]|uniref:Conserved oligomeric Golgi complex subunit 3 n=1 Tax=Rhynchospora breviuscula TaxID=2022672 RepID=A0A9Q0CCM0_9POAL|nr:hypothetical protein LUZ63_015560 [Rhynchospora breviuscula]